MTTIIPLKPRAAKPRKAWPRASLFIWLAIASAAALLAYQSRLVPSGQPSVVRGGEVFARFAMCNGTFVRNNCVVDGDTFYLHGEKIRLAGIDAPETHPSRCLEEERLGRLATARLLDLLNAGPFTLARAGRDEDVYGRKLRTVRRDGQSIGTVLVSEGLARRWTGRRLPWCT